MKDAERVEEIRGRWEKLKVDWFDCCCFRNDEVAFLLSLLDKRDKELDVAINAYDGKAVEYDALKVELEKVKADNAGLIEGLKKIAAHEGKYYPVDTMVDIAKEALAAYTEWEKGQTK